MSVTASSTKDFSNQSRDGGLKPNWEIGSIVRLKNEIPVYQAALNTFNQYRAPYEVTVIGYSDKSVRFEIPETQEKFTMRNEHAILLYTDKENCQMKTDCSIFQTASYYQTSRMRPS